MEGFEQYGRLSPIQVRKKPYGDILDSTVDVTNDLSCGTPLSDSPNRESGSLLSTSSIGTASETVPMPKGGGPSGDALRKRIWRARLPESKKQEIRERERERKRQRFLDKSEAEQEEYRRKDRERKREERRGETGMKKERRLKKERERKARLREQKKMAAEQAKVTREGENSRRIPKPKSARSMTPSRFPIESSESGAQSSASQENENKRRVDPPLEDGDRSLALLAQCYASVLSLEANTNFNTFELCFAPQLPLEDQISTGKEALEAFEKKEMSEREYSGNLRNVDFDTVLKYLERF